MSHNTEQDEDEDDYMSDKILNQIVDTRPGLVFKRETARKYELEKKIDEKNKQNRQLPRAQLEEQKRNEALSTSSLKPDNKGLNLMLKMGYKLGEGIGKKEGLVEPISIEIKTDREGLGQSSQRKLKLEEIENLRESLKSRKREQEDHSEKSYLNYKRTKFNLRKLRYNLHKCQRICYQLDSSKGGLKKPEVTWYWPGNVLMAEPEVVETKVEETILPETELKTDYKEKVIEESDKPKVNLQKVFDERLETFLTTKEDTNDEGENDEDFFEDENFKNQVNIEKKRNENEDLSDIDEKFDEDNEELMIKKIDSICLYLREKYFYCVWCATTFTNEQDMSLNCPGLSEKEHEDDNE